MFFRLVLLFTAVPLVELIILIELGRRIGTLDTIFIILFTGIAGAFLAKSQGFHVISKIKEQLNRGDIPTDELLDGAFVLAGAALLLTPGILTDFLGLSFLIPAVRRAWKRLARSLLKRWVTGAGWRTRW